MADLKGRRILISNDDGIAAPGLVVLERIAKMLSDDIWVVAPASERSGAGHSLTLHEPLRLNKLAEQRYSINGTPTDCVMIAVNHLLKDQPPDLVLSGVNMGVNLGEDVHYSGTVAAAMEGALLGYRAIALSQDFSDAENVPWNTALHFAPDLIQKACAQGWPKQVLINVNFPGALPDDVKGIKVARQGKHKIGDDLVYRHDPRGKPYFWIGSRRLADTSVDDTDLKAVGENFISVTPLNVDLTHDSTIAALRNTFS
ncbi:MAG: 5'/3'-nucleotidase SurE [Rhodobacteraceae bacterium]|nr:5'/3'-nucleotidase SurE [Paracoccaceae bacterium]